MADLEEQLLSKEDFTLQQYEQAGQHDDEEDEEDALQMALEDSLPISEQSDHELLSIISSRAKRNNFLLSLSIMLICGSSNDFLGKLAYQILPGDDSGLEGLYIDYWALWWLTTGSFFICSFALCGKKARASFSLLDKPTFYKICIPSFMDLFVTGGRYLSLIFLPAAIISILKNGFQLFFLALIRRFWRRKMLTNLQWAGLAVTIVGLLVVSGGDILDSLHNAIELKRSIIGLALLIVVGFLGSIRNHMEEVLLQHEDESKQLDSNFLVGMESIISLFFMVLLGVVLLFTDPFKKDEDYDDIGEGFSFIAGYPAFIVCYLLFIAAIFGKDTMQMKIAQMTSSLTRKLFQQLYPIGTWILSLVTYYIYSQYGEPWDKYAWFRLFGFVVVLVGTYFYIKPPKQFRPTRKETNLERQLRHTIEQL